MIFTILIIEAVCTSETSVYSNETARHYIPEGCCTPGYLALFSVLSCTDVTFISCFPVRCAAVCLGVCVWLDLRGLGVETPADQHRRAEIWSLVGWFLKKKNFLFVARLENIGWGSASACPKAVSFWLRTERTDVLSWYVQVSWWLSNYFY
jgi:hypothetical protein